MNGDIQQMRQAIRAFIIRRYFRNDEDLSVLQDGTSLVANSIIDSLDKHELVLHVIRTYQIEIDPYEEATEFESIDSIAQLVVRKQRAVAATRKAA